MVVNDGKVLGGEQDSARDKIQAILRRSRYHFFQLARRRGLGFVVQLASEDTSIY